VLGDMVNTAARLMGHAGENQILISEAVYQAIAGRFACEVLGVIPLKGKAETMPVLVLNGPLAEA
jgi:class 3 adenylate cyclase